MLCLDFPSEHSLPQLYRAATEANVLAAFSTVPLHNLAKKANQILGVSGPAPRNPDRIFWMNLVSDSANKPVSLHAV